MHSLPVSILRAVQLAETVDAELNKWLSDHVSKGADPDDMVSALVRSGKQPDLAALIVGLARQNVFLGRHIDDRLVSRVGPVDQVAPHADYHFIDGGDRQVRKVISLGSLEVILYEGFITEEEMEHIKTLTLPMLQRSSVVGPNFTNREDTIRTSYGAFLETDCDAIVRGLEKRIEKVTGIPATHGEGLQVLRYESTQEYKPHYDFFEPRSENERRMMVGPGNRRGTMIFYLSDVAEGGSTYFPQLKLAIHPKKGSALWFGYLGEDGVLDQRSEHAGLPLISGEKWIATKWLRERPMPKVAQHPEMTHQYATPAEASETRPAPPSSDNVVPFARASNDSQG